ncbi:MAG: DUF1326 domain-containing protein [Bryobacterales bacterium]|nr:DUF1326 domain-containing protein [Bryobacterales bacterium]
MRILRGLAIVAASACLTLAASAASHESHATAPAPATLTGTYMEARTADVYIGECFRNSEVGLVGDLGVMGWNVAKGSFDGVNLDGLSVIAVVRASNTIGNIHQDYLPSKAVLVVDAKANAMQRVALENLARKLGGALVSDVVAVNVEPIAMAFEHGDVHSREGFLKAGTLVNLQTRAIERADKICSHENTVYDPMASGVDHAMPAYTIANSFTGKGLDTTWSSPYKLSAFVGTFAVNDGGMLISHNE